MKGAFAMSLYHKNSALFVRHIELNVKDLSKMADFYTRVLQFNILKETETVVIFSFDGVNPILTLHQTSDLKDKRTTLYHVAYLYPNQYALSKVLKHIALSKYPITGGADHTVSEAIYLDDPEGNGIELYVDTDPTAWSDIESHPERLENKPFPYQAYLNDTYTLEGNDLDPIIGHVHLHTSNLTESTNFFQDILGFDMIVRIPSAHFLSTADYHHHIALNTWRKSNQISVGLGLRKMVMDTDDLSLKHRLIEHIKQNIDYQIRDGFITFKDNDHNVITIPMP